MNDIIGFIADFCASDKPLFLQEAIRICKEIENGEVRIIVSPHTDKQTGYLLSELDKKEYNFIKFSDCTKNNQPNWMAYRDGYRSLYLKSTVTGRIYYLSC